MSTPPLPLIPDCAERSSVSAIVFEDVHLSFEDNAVLRGVSFQLPFGETKALFGVAGAGKSTILKLALGLLRPDSGRITVLGNEVTQMREQDLFPMRGQLGMVFQESALFDSLPVREALRFVELEHTLDLFPSELSGGMRRRVAIARAIITQPELLLYDSPTGGLDPVTSTTIVELIVKQRDVNKTSSLLVSHRLQDAFTMATHFYDRQTSKMVPLPPGSRRELPVTFLVIREGKVIFDGDAQELATTKDEYIREYIS